MEMEHWTCVIRLVHINRDYFLSPKGNKDKKLPQNKQEKKNKQKPEDGTKTE